MSDGSGPKYNDPLAVYDHVTSCWKTSVVSLQLEGLSTPSSVDWPRSGTMRGGRVYPLPMWGRPTSGTESGLWPHRHPFPTPSAVSYGTGGNGSATNTNSRGRPSLETMAKRLPTPNTQDAKGAGSWKSRLEGKQMQLHQAVRMLPTPTVQDGENNGGPSQYERNSLPLNALVIKPEEAEKGLLNPVFVEAMMGFEPGWTEVPGYSTIRGSKTSRRSRSASSTAPTASVPSAMPSCPKQATSSSGPSTKPTEESPDARE